jgi:fused signal recognition particle receptor
VGKTTSIAKLADYYQHEGKSCLLVAGDTFRAGAIEQLKVWGERLKIDVIHHQEGADPGAVVFDGMAAVNARHTEVVIIDTAGRLHTKVNLMSELKKVHRIVRQNLGGRSLVNLLVLDATTGQNALAQAKTFQEAVGVDGIILTKLDGTAKGGITLAISAQLGLPIVWVGVGEQPGDLKPFAAKKFVEALFS